MNRIILHQRRLQRKSALRKIQWQAWIDIRKTQNVTTMLNGFFGTVFDLTHTVLYDTTSEQEQAKVTIESINKDVQVKTEKLLEYVMSKRKQIKEIGQEVGLE